MKRVLILGYGFIGTRLLETLTGQDDIISVQCLSNTSSAVTNIDYTDYTQLVDYLQSAANNGESIDYVINASGFTGVPNVDGCEDEKEACWELNAVSPVISYIASAACNARYIHISSGCIYDGYKTTLDGWREDDTPNFGLYSNQSSYYSKTKHAGEIGLTTHAETVSADLRPIILRIRMPFTKDNTSRNLFNKILKYPKLIDYRNSMTCVEDLNKFIKDAVTIDLPAGIYNVVHSSPTSTSHICSILEEYGLSNPDWEYISIDTLKELKYIKSNRSNCTLSTDKIRSYDMELPNITDALTQSISLLSKQRQWTSNELLKKSC